MKKSIQILIPILSFMFFASCHQAQNAHGEAVDVSTPIVTKTGEKIDRVSKTPEEWKKELSDFEY